MQTALLVLLAASAASAMLLPDLPAGVSTATDVVTVPFPADVKKTPFFEARMYRKITTTTKRPYWAYAGLLQDPSYFMFALPGGTSCSTRQKTSITAAQHNCLYATNGGFFKMATPSACEGNLVINGSAIQLPGDARANFGVTKDGKMVLGFIDKADLAKFNFAQLITGVGWLVRDGKSNVEHSRDLNTSSSFVKIKAPRTTIGVMPNGQLVLYQTDGVESTKEGLDLFELAEALVEFGVLHAVNIDGGGSSVSFYRGQIIDQPTCQDTPTPLCERAVTSITCVRYQ